MYKQKCIGSRGPLMPAVGVLSCALILYSAAYALVQGQGWSEKVFLFWAMTMLVVAALTWRYTRVEIEYMWFSGELVVRRSDRIRNYRLVICRENIDGLRGRGLAVGQRTWGYPVRNCCATLRGRTMDRCTLYYHDENGHTRKLYFQPTDELLSQVIAAKTEKKKA